jgi:hypothetical protein
LLAQTQFWQGVGVLVVLLCVISLAWWFATAVSRWNLRAALLKVLEDASEPLAFDEVMAAIRYHYDYDTCLTPDTEDVRDMLRRLLAEGKVVLLETLSGRTRWCVNHNTTRRPRSRASSPIESITT